MLLIFRWLAHRRGQNQLTLMYQLSVNAEAKKGKDIHTLMDSLAHAPCSARGSCGDCTGKVREVFLIHVGGTRCVTSSTDNNYEHIQARITLTVECIRTCLCLFLFEVEIQLRV